MLFFFQCIDIILRLVLQLLNVVLNLCISRAPYCARHLALFITHSFRIINVYSTNLDGITPSICHWQAWLNNYFNLLNPITRCRICHPKEHFYLSWTHTPHATPSCSNSTHQLITHNQWVQTNIKRIIVPVQLPLSIKNQF